MNVSRHPDVLVLDDEPPFRGLLKLRFALLDWRCEVVATPEEALARLKKRHFDLIVADHYLCNCNGLAFICRLRQYGYSTPVILMSWDPNILALAPNVILNIPAVLIRPFGDSQLEKALSLISVPQGAVRHADGTSFI